MAGQRFVTRGERGGRRFIPRVLRQRFLHVERIPVSSPYGCGHSRLSFRRAVEIHGSPPRVWGQRYPSNGTTLNTRFTPTGVGTALAVAGQCPQHTVHPHGCGDSIRPPDLPGQLIGSPPRVWGQPHVTADGVPFSRFTPTGVGTASMTSSKSRLASVHPHGCGDSFS